MPRWEKIAILVIFLLILAIKIRYIHALPINSDEPQHLHVAWGWTQGMVQYRDYFDNHTPLFHLMMAPLVSWIGERATILFTMRIAMIPFFAASLGCIYWLGACLYSKRAGIWAAVLTGTFPVFLLKGSEFRTDVPWVTIWLATVAIGLTGRFTGRRAFATGLLFGVTFGVSMKTSLLLVSVLAALGLLLLLLPQPERKAFLSHSLGKALSLIAGLCVVPLAIAGFFASQGALSNLIYCVFTHNAVPGRGLGVQFFVHLAFFLLLLTGLVFAGKAVLRADKGHPQTIPRTLLFLTSAFFLLFLYCFWPHLTAQNFLPVVPLCALTVAAWVLRYEKAGPIVLVLIAIAQLSLATKEVSPFRKRVVRNESLVADVLRLTKPSDFVMDAKGETLFRRRPFYYVLESLTQERMRLGLIEDTIADEMVKTRTCVTLLKRLPEKSEKWVERFYLLVTMRVLVAGCYLPPEHGEVRHFEVGVAADYVVTSCDGPVAGTMDGVPCEGPVFLNPGPHTFSCKDDRLLAVFWAQAAQRGFSPLHFHPKDAHK